MAAAAITFPRLMMITGASSGKDVAATGVVEGLSDSVYYDTFGVGMFHIMAKIEVEPAKIDSRYVHLRFLHTNKYWAQQDWLVFSVPTKEEDTSKARCTLFEPVSSASGGGVFGLIHVQSGRGVVIANTPSVRRFILTTDAVDRDAFRFVDAQTVVKLPPSVAFRGSNGKFLQFYMHSNGSSHLQFSSDDPNAEGAVQQVELLPDGNVQIKCVLSGGYWRNGSGWIVVDSPDSTPFTLHRPTKIDSETIAIKPVSGNAFARIHTGSGVTDVLYAVAPSIIPEARLQVHELVSQRDIYDVSYRMFQARIYNEAPYLAGEARLRNSTDVVATQNVYITYSDVRSYTFSRSFPLRAGVSTTLAADVRFYDGKEWSAGLEINGSYEWDTTSIRTTRVTGTGTVDVPPRSSVLVRYMGTRGTSSIPYNYTQRDLNSTNNETVYIPQTDGLYQCVNNYNFDFVTAEVRPI